MPVPLKLTLRRTVYTYPGAAGAADELTTVPTGTGRHVITAGWDNDGDPILTTVTGKNTRIKTTATPEEEETPEAAVPVETPKADAGDAAQQGGGGKGIQGPPTTTYPPMTATTYGYKNQAGDWVTTEWYQSYTAPSEATATYSEGRILDLQEYKDSQKGMTDKAVQPGSAKQGTTSGAGHRVASVGVAAALAAVIYYAL